MKKLSVVLLAALSASAFAQSTYVRPHIRHDGTYVEGHHRSTPDHTVDNNYGTRGNINPYTGQEGTQPRSWERPAYEAPRHETPRSTYGTDCGYTASGRYVCR
jgi:hypothetical protein